MPSRRTLLTTFAAGAGVVALGATGYQAFAEPASAAAAPKPRSVDLKPGKTNSNNAALQYLLNVYGAKLTADGYYGPLTEKAVAKFQGAKGLVKDGWAGPKTMAKMLNSHHVAAKRGWNKSRTARAAQTLLVKLGYSMAVDGNFGELTESSVKKVQKKYKISQSGTMTYTTWTFMFNPPSSDGGGNGGLRKGPAVLVSQSGTGLNSWMADCGPAGFVSVLLRLGKTPKKWTTVANRAAAIDYARRNTLGMTNPSRGTGQIRDEIGLVAGFKRLGVDRAKTGGTSGALSAVRSGGVSMLGGNLAVCARWNGRSSSKVLHWIAILDYSKKSGKYQVADPSSKHNKLVWVSEKQLRDFAAIWGDSVCIK